MAVMQRPRPHHAVITGSAVVSVAGIVVALVVYAHTKSGLALFVAICVAVGSVLSFGSVVAARAMIASATTAGHPGTERLTGRVLSPYPRPASKARTLPAGGWAWTGGARVPAALGWLNASMGLAVLEVVPPKVTLRIRGGRLFGAEPVVVEPVGDVRCYPVRGRMPGTVGVALHRATAAPAYFWTFSTVEILAALQWAGFNVSWQEHRPAWW
jgi:hypothetical protein